MSHVRNLLVASCAAFAFAACSESTGIDDNNVSSGSGALVGRIELQSSSSSSDWGDGVASFDANGITVAAARVRSDGALEVLASAAAAADGSYRIENVPAGEDRLLVVASAGGVEVGRAIAHAAVSQNSASTVAPITFESSVEGRVFAELIRQGTPKQSINTVELAQAVEVDSRASAEALIASPADLSALARAIKLRQETYTEVLTRLGISFDSRARFAAALAAAAEHANARHAGSPEAGAEARLNADVAAAYAAKGADARAQAQASAAAETGLLRAAQVANANARLDIAQAALDANLTARERLVVDMLSKLGVAAADIDAVKQALARAHSRVAAASTVAEANQAVADGMAEAQARFEAHVSSRVPAQASERMRAALAAVPSAAALETRLAGAATAGAIAESYVSFFTDLRSSIMTMVSQMAGAGGGVDGEATANFFTGLRAIVQAR